jgi:PKD repeat protein
MILCFCFCGCYHKHNYVACFVPSKEVVAVDELITFEDCSDYDGGREFAFWNFGDGTKINTENKKPAIHKYSQPGEYTVYLSIGLKEWGSSITKTIIVQ